MKTLAFILFALTWPLQAVTVNCNSANNCITNAAALTSGDTLYQTSNFPPTSSQLVISVPCTLVQAPGVRWIYTGSASGITIQAGVMLGGLVTFKNFTFIANGAGTAISVGSNNNDTAGFKLTFVDSFVGVTRPSNTAGAALNIDGFLNGLSLTASRTTFLRLSGSNNNRTIFSTGGNSSFRYYLFENSMVFNGCTGTSSSTAFTTGSQSDIFISRNSTFAAYSGSAVNGCLVLNNGNSNSGGVAYAELINTVVASLGTAPVDAPGLTLSASTLVQNCAFYRDSLAIGTNNFRVSSSDFMNPLSANFRPSSGLSQLTYGGMDMSGTYTRDIIGILWDTARFGVGAYYAQPNRIIVPSSNFVVPTRTVVPSANLTSVPSANMTTVGQ